MNWCPSRNQTASFPKPNHIGINLNGLDTECCMLLWNAKGNSMCNSDGQYHTFKFQNDTNCILWDMGSPPAGRVNGVWCSNFTSASSHHCLCNFYIFTTVMDTIWSDNWMHSFSFKRKCTYAEHLCIITLYLAQAWCLCITFWCHDRHLVWAHAHRPFPWCSAGRGPLPHAAFIYMICLCKHHLWLPRGLKQDQTSIS